MNINCMQWTDHELNTNCNVLQRNVSKCNISVLKYYTEKTLRRVCDNLCYVESDIVNQLQINTLGIGEWRGILKNKIEDEDMHREKK